MTTDFHCWLVQLAQKISKVLQIPVQGRVKQAPKIEVQPQETQAKKKKNFGGKGGPSGNLNKGIKNAKRAAAPH